MADGARQQELKSARNTLWQLLYDGGDVSWDEVYNELQRQRYASVAAAGFCKVLMEKI